jgi:hypothetical protein
VCVILAVSAHVPAREWIPLLKPLQAVRRSWCRALRPVKLAVGTVALTLGVAIMLGAGAPLVASAAPAFHCPRIDIIQTGCKGPKDCQYPAPDPAQYYLCSVNPDGDTATATLMSCAPGTVWNDAEKMCDFESSSVGTSATTLTTSLSVPLEGPETFTANLSLSDGSAPLQGRDISFTAPDGSLLCTATTDANGNASCTVSADLTVLASYTATFGGYETEAPATATGLILL